jgi:toxin ParE1/3/4
VTPFIQSPAEDDVLKQVEWYAERGLPDIARRFHAAVAEAINALVTMPAAGMPKPSANPRLAGLRTWPLKGFDAFRVYYLAQHDRLVIVRVLHDKRDTDAVLGGHTVEDPGLC